MKVKLNCQACNKEFEVIQSRANKAKTCSLACKGALQALKYSEERAEKTCPQCDSVFTMPVSHVSRRTYCSKECADDAKVGTYHGPLAADGITGVRVDGYIWERSRHHPFAHNRMVLQHRLVIERQLRKEDSKHSFLVDVNGEKYLSQNISVHHMNEVKSDNSLSNLLACTGAAHRGIHEGRKPYQDEVWPEGKVDVVPENANRLVELSCKRCGAIFEAKRSKVEKGRKYCSRSCYDATKYVGDLPSMIQRECMVCGSQFKARRQKVLDGFGKYCSNACRHEGYEKPKKAINH